jgi:hypothetical protein
MVVYVVSARAAADCEWVSNVCADMDTVRAMYPSLRWEHSDEGDYAGFIHGRIAVYAQRRHLQTTSDFPEAR